MYDDLILALAYAAPVGAVAILAHYLGACAGARRMLTLREWWRG